MQEGRERLRIGSVNEWLDVLFKDKRTTTVHSSRFQLGTLSRLRHLPSDFADGRRAGEILNAHSFAIEAYCIYTASTSLE